MVQVPPYESSVCDKMDGLFPPLGGERPVKRHIKKKLGGGQVEKEQLKSSGGQSYYCLSFTPSSLVLHMNTFARKCVKINCIVSAHARSEKNYIE